MSSYSKIKEKIKREIRLYSVQAPVTLTITEDGIEMAVSGQQKKIASSWESIARGAQTPGDVPSYLAGKPLDFLKYQAEARNRRNNKKEDNVHRASSA
jgi:hypothetical protein